MNRSEFLWILQSVLLSFAGKSEAEIKFLCPRDCFAMDGICIHNYIKNKSITKSEEEKWLNKNVK